MGILLINKPLENICQTEPTTFFRRNKNRQKRIGSNKVEYSKIKKQNIKIKRGKYSPCLVDTLLQKKMVSSSTCKKIVEQKILQKIHELNSFKTYVIYICYLVMKIIRRKK